MTTDRMLMMINTIEMPMAIFLFPTKSKLVPGLINSMLFSSMEAQDVPKY
ncbi:MAG: hypothetical protein BWX99_02841 [Deltaproteobacteria bacterium ADurb.Bin151]|nr:MAG: hypothetical protein BWX99_02841 [Deltaproteobacteria bacterium ADurb.Bin151]